MVVEGYVVHIFSMKPNTHIHSLVLSAGPIRAQADIDEDEEDYAEEDGAGEDDYDEQDGAATLSSSMTGSMTSGLKRARDEVEEEDDVGPLADGADKGYEEDTEERTETKKVRTD